ncbi:hypothetical protein FRUB_04472 [Fimbriiglobus ruber]|uniref:SMEK domain-containing protein n=1 Tax=Fimbriiglobus ruber TaxID=1908690 RepID=A0A225DS15_9BACT|nr:hypothetical protein FRUB_04472 [Fimbriiglobus ruber]
MLNQVYGWNVTSTNKEKANYPCIDLIDAGRKLGIQVTAERDSDKVNDTLACLEKNKMADRVARLKVLLLVPKQKKYTINAPCPGVSFAWETDVMDFDDVIAAAQAITDLQRIGRVQQCVVNAMPSIFPQYSAPRAIGDGSDGQAAASALLQHYRDLYTNAGPEKENKVFQHALQRSEAHAKDTLKGKIILLTAIVEQQLAKTTGLAVSSESDFGLLRAMEWARELRTFRNDIYREASATEQMAPAYDRLEHVHKAAKQLMDSLMIHADWSDSAEKAVSGTRDRLEALLSRVAALSENTVQTRPKRFITPDELNEAKWAAAECTRIAMEVEKVAGRI